MHNSARILEAIGNNYHKYSNGRKMCSGVRIPPLGSARGRHLKFSQLNKRNMASTLLGEETATSYHILLLFKCLQYVKTPSVVGARPWWMIALADNVTRHLPDSHYPSSYRQQHGNGWRRPNRQALHNLLPDLVPSGTKLVRNRDLGASCSLNSGNSSLSRVRVEAGSRIRASRNEEYSVAIPTSSHSSPH